MVEIKQWPVRLWRSLKHPAQRTRLLTEGGILLLVMAAGAALGWAIPNLPLLYIALGIGGVVCVVLAFFYIEYAVLFLLFMHGILQSLDHMSLGADFLNPNRALALLIFAGGVVYFLTHEVDYERIPAFFPALAFLGMCFVSVGYNFKGDFSLLIAGMSASMRLGTALVIYAVLVSKIESRSQVNWVVGAIVAAQIYPTVNGLLTVLRGGGRTFGNMSTARLGGGTSGVGVFLVLPTTLCLLHFLRAKTPFRRALFGGLTGLFVIALFYSYGRAGWIGFLVVLSIIGVVRHQMVLTLLPAALVIVLMTVPAISARFADIDSRSLEDADASTLGDRIELWRTALELYRGSPLLGIGFGIAQTKVGALLDTGRPQEIHNDYIQALSATGILGFLAFMWWQITLLLDAFRAFRWSQDPHDQTLTLALLALLISFAVMRLTDNIISNARLYPLMALAAAVLAVPRLRAIEADQGVGQ